MRATSLSKSEVKSIILNAQLLDGHTDISSGKKGTAKIINHLGYVQIDTISVIQRAHHHILWTRQADYQPGYLHQLQQNDKAIFEYWGHAMSYMPMSDYRFALPRMKNLEEPKTPWAKKQYEVCGHLLDPVLERIKNEGPLSAKDFEHEKKNNSGWWDWKPAKVALELLFWRGDLMITERRKFQKIYDLTERVLPDHINTSFPDKKEIGHFLVKRALQSLGVANEKEILRFMQPGSARDSDLQMAGKEVIAITLNELIEKREILSTTIENAGKEVNYTAVNHEKKINPVASKQVHILSPFDNLIIQRERTKRLFDFDYTLECYVPEKKRKYGYFVLPILWGDPSTGSGQRFVGRMDAKADRKKNTLDVLKLHFEDNFSHFDHFLPHFVKKLRDFAEFNDCTVISIQKVSNNKIISELKSLLA